MSKLLDLIRSSLPTALVIPEPLERSWSWIEAQGWATENGTGYYLTPYPGRRQLGIVFSASETLAGWFEAGEPGSDRLFPLGQSDGSGGITALWLDPSDTVRFVLLGSEGERFLLAGDAVDFLRLIAIGYLELGSFSLGVEPSEEDEDSVAALSEFRSWVENEFSVDVPALWSTLESDPFDAWVTAVKGE